MDIQAFARLVVQGSMTLIVLGIGLQGNWHSVAYVLSRPSLIFRAIIAVYVVVPMVATGLCLIFPIAPAVRAGIIIMAVSPLAPLVLRKMLKSGADDAYVIGIYVIMILASVLLVPATIALLAIALGRDFALPVMAIFKFVSLSTLLPLSVGLVVASLWPKLAARTSPVVSIVGFSMLAPVIALVLYKSSAQMLSLVGDGTLLTIVVTILSGFVAGHIFGGPKPQYRAALAQAAATRHPGMAGLIAGMHFSDPKVMLTVLLFLVVGVLLTTLYAMSRGTTRPAHNGFH